jgi:hypothetical protein
MAVPKTLASALPYGTNRILMISPAPTLKFSMRFFFNE